MNLIKKNYSKDYFKSSAKINFDSDRNRRRLCEIVSRKPKGSLIEIGCGKGGFVKLASRYFRVEGMDVSKYAVNFAKRFTGKKIKLSDIQKCRLDEKSYDVVAAFNVFEHLEETELVAKNIYKSLKNKGILIGSVPNNFGLIGKINTLLTNFFDRTHRSTYTPKKWLEILKDAGFKKINFFGEVTLTNHNVKYIKSNFWKYLSFNLVFVCIKL